MVKGSLRTPWSVLLLVALLPITPSVMACLDGTAPDCCERSGHQAGSGHRAGLHAEDDCHCCVVVDQVASERASRVKVSMAVSLETAGSSASPLPRPGVLARAHPFQRDGSTLTSLRTVVLLI